MGVPSHSREGLLSERSKRLRFGGLYLGDGLAGGLYSWGEGRGSIFGILR